MDGGNVPSAGPGGDLAGKGDLRAGHHGHSSGIWTIRPMARSTYIYLLISDEVPVAAFTVKHEMDSWIERNPGTYRQMRMRDGLHGPKLPEEMSDAQ